MTPAFSARRRADEFEALVSGSRRATRDPEQYDDLLTLVEGLRSVPEVPARPEFVAGLRERLMAEAETALVPDTPQRLAMPVRSRRRDRRIAALLGSAALVGSTATMAVAAQGALPGEALYPFKRGLESAEVRLAGDDAARGLALLSSAEHRLTELESLAADGDAPARGLIPGTLEDFSEQAAAAGDLLVEAYDDGADQAAVEAVRTFSSESMSRLEALEPQLPPGAHDELADAGRTLADIDAQAAAACPFCAGGIGTLPDFLLSAGATDLLSGLDRDSVQLAPPPAPISGQDTDGLTVPDALKDPTATSSPTPLEQLGDKVKEGGEKVKDGLTQTGDGIKGTTGGLTTTLDGV
ncbi:MAG: DUF5667 domain-containing protein, partial [Nocardioides sp.]|nr:DUF5667 domain-containing protein [Nocardioides sp.]